MKKSLLVAGLLMAPIAAFAGSAGNADMAQIYNTENTTSRAAVMMPEDMPMSMAPAMENVYMPTNNMAGMSVTSEGMELAPMQMIQTPTFRQAVTAPVDMNTGMATTSLREQNLVDSYGNYYGLPANYEQLQYMPTYAYPRTYSNNGFYNNYLAGQAGVSRNEFGAVTDHLDARDSYARAKLNRLRRIGY